MEKHIFKNAEQLSQGIADWIVDLIQQNSRNNKQFDFLLSGGNTPKELYRLLATEKYKHEIDWKRINIFFGDERVVPFEDERNNGRMAYDTLLKHVPVPKSQIHYINTSIKPELSALSYESLLRDHFARKEFTFDLSLLGMGDDGHTLSVFPGSGIINEKQRWVTSAYVPEQQMYRVTLTPIAVNKSKRVAFLVAGSSKWKVLSNILNPTAVPHFYPAQLIYPSNGELHWFVDEAAYRSELS